MDPKDTLKPAASPEEIPVEKALVEPEATESAAPEATPEKVYAGKYNSPEELEKAYVSAQAKIGEKGFIEAIGKEIVTATGYSVDELKAAGYTPQQIREAVVTYQNTGTQSPPKEDITQRVESSKLESIEFKLQLRDYFEDNPGAKEFKNDIEEWREHPACKGMSPQEIFESKLSKFMKKGEDAAYNKQGEKEKATMSISNNPVPETKESDAALEAYRKNPRSDTETAFIKARLAGK